MAWLNATPKKDKKSRLVQFKEAGYTPEGIDELFPNVGEAHYIIGLFYDAGVWMSTGMGNTSLTWLEINNWINCNELALSLWERKMIKHLSETYVSEFSKSDVMCPSPYSNTEQRELESEEVIGNRVASQLRSISNKQRE